MPSVKTRAAEGLDRRSFTVAEILRMQEAGIISEDEKFELVEGEIVPMQAKSHIHELIKSTLLLKLARSLPNSLWLGVESSIYLSSRTFLEPDLVIYPNGMKLEQVKGSDVIIAIEVAASTLPYDHGLKARIYARHGVRELWVIDANERRTFVHTEPSGEAWRTIRTLEPDADLRIEAMPQFSARLSEI
jgi:Uma2 family endonuclease